MTIKLPGGEMIQNFVTGLRPIILVVLVLLIVLGLLYLLMNFIWVGLPVLFILVSTLIGSIIRGDS